MEFVKVPIKGTKLFYWTWKDLPFLPYAWLDKLVGFVDKLLETSISKGKIKSEKELMKALGS